MAVLICGKDDWSRNGSDLSGNKRKCQFQQPASGNVTQREAQPFTRSHKASKTGSLATEENPRPTAGSLGPFPRVGRGGKRTPHFHGPVTPLAVSATLLAPWRQWVCLLTRSRQSSLIIHFWITDRRVLAAMTTTECPYLFKKKCPKRCSHFFFMTGIPKRNWVCETEMWMGGEKTPSKCSLQIIK